MNEVILSARGLTKHYGGFPALDQLNIDVYKGRIIGLLGPNGCGKTTFIKLAAGLLFPTSGTVTVGGMTVGPQAKRIVSYLPDRDFLPRHMRVKELLKMYTDFFEDFDNARAVDMLTRLGVDFSQKFDSMSKGTRERVQLALVMSRRAELYLLDEPIAAVDPAAREYILRTVLENYKEGSAVLISTHLISEVEPIIDDVIMLQNGTLRLYGPADRIRADTGGSIDALFREVYRC